MKEYIERETLLQALEEIGGCGAPPESWADGWDKAISRAIKLTEEQPAADMVKVRHGKWNIVDGDFYWVDGKCSVCGYTDCFDESRFYKYCPECGAKMDGNVGDDND